LNSFSQATTVAPSTSTSGKSIYTADVKRDWCIGLVPHGGYLMSLIAKAVQCHFQHRHSDLNQTDLITFHVEFLTRSAVGYAEIVIHELKIRRQFSTVRVQLLQYTDKGRSGVPRICLESLVTVGNLSREAQSGGLSLPTRPTLTADSIPKRANCEDWVFASEWPSRRPAAFKLQSPPPGWKRRVVG